MLNLTLVYSNGDGVIKNKEKALNYLFEAADHGNQEAIEVLNTVNSMFNN